MITRTGTDNDTKLGTTQVAGTLAVPGAANTNNCAIVHYDGGTIAIPEDAHIESATSGAEGYAQRVFGSTTIGSVRVIDSLYAARPRLMEAGPSLLQPVQATVVKTRLIRTKPNRTLCLWNCMSPPLLRHRAFP